MEGSHVIATLDSIIADLEQRLPQKRFLHTLGVLETATALCHLHGGDSRKVAMAALLHDCAKGLDRNDLEAMIASGKFSVSDFDRDFPALWHGAAGAYIARAEFGIDDEEIVDAIEHHTLGHSQPSTTLRLLMAADSLEPMRDYEGIEQLREAATKDLRTGLIAILKEKVAHVKSKGRKPHPRIHETITSLEGE